MRYLLCALLATAALRPAEAPARAPVLVELFTSEGCSSCPPADRLLQQLDSRAVVLSEHVTYWNQEGWKDPYSSEEWTARQAAYGKRFSLDAPYTPDMVVDGAVEFGGDMTKRSVEEIAMAASQPKVDLRLTRTGDSIRVDAAASSLAGGVYLALADDHDESKVSAGENKGVELSHVAVLRSIRKIGAIKRDSSFSQTVRLPYGSAAERVVVFVQDQGPGKIHGAAMLPPASAP
ncbi:MAG TPA: DUF1223 domain-containing protein [Bryobacteraceae bacterium]|nr:DUF1223 domain-containing protein [Bryobacteraceae bacterium]